MIKCKRDPERQQPVSVIQAEVDLLQASFALDPYGCFEKAPGPLVWTFKEACERRDQAAAGEAYCEN